MPGYDNYREGQTLSMSSSISMPLDKRKAKEKEAFENMAEGDLSADGLRGLAREIKALNFLDFRRTEEITQQLNTLLQKYSNEIVIAIRAFSQIAPEFARKNGDARIQGDPKAKAEQFLSTVYREDFKLNPNGDNYYTWQEVCSVLELVAKHMDSLETKH